MSQAKETAEKTDASTAASESANSGDRHMSLCTRILDFQKKTRQESKELTKLASCFTSLTKEANHVDINRLETQLAKARLKVEALKVDSVRHRGLSVLRQCEDSTERRRERLAKRLGAELREKCEAEGLSMKVLSREEPVELRISPLSVLIDRTKGSAQLRFARTEIASCPADADQIIKQYKRISKELNRALKPKAFFEACHRAWLACRAIKAKEGGERVEILDFLPYLALNLQKARFYKEPRKDNYSDYSRAQFAFDVLRLKNQKQLTQGGLRLNLGVATGNSAGNKDRVIWFEDEEGNGEYKLTVYFSKVET